MRQGEVVENKRLSEVMDIIKERQRERTEAVNDPAESAPAARRSASADRYGLLRRGSTVTHAGEPAARRDGAKRESGLFYFGEHRTSVLWADTPGAIVLTVGG